MLVREAMTAPVVTVPADSTLREAAVVLLERAISSAPVVDGSGQLVGVVSEADLVRGRTQRDPRAAIMVTAAISRQEADDEAASGDPALAVGVREVMSHPPLCVRGEDDVDLAARLMLEHGVKMLPVVDAGRVVGVLSRRDLLRTLARSDEDVARDVRELLAELGQDRGVQVEVVDGVVTLHAEHDAGRTVAAVLARTVPGVVRVHRARPEQGD